MANIRNDLVGVVHAFRATGETVVLKAGDEVPAGIRLGSHLIAPAGESPQFGFTPAPLVGVPVAELPDDEHEDQADAAPVAAPAASAPKRRGRPPKAATDGAGN